MAEYKTPGVYVEEISKFPPSVAGVATAIPAFIGFTQTVPKDGTNKAVKVKSLLDYQAKFGYGPELTIGENGDLQGNEFVLYDSIRLFYDNGGGTCYVVSIGDYKATEVKAEAYTNGLDSLKKVDEVTLLVAPDAAMLMEKSQLGSLHQAMLGQCSELGDRFAILDPKIADGLDQDMETFRNKVGNNYLSYGAAYYPYLKTTYSKEIGFESVMKALIHDQPDLQAKLDEINSYGEEEKALRIKAAIPQIQGYAEKLAEMLDKASIIPPSGAIAGIYAATDGSKGVWQAPANVSIASVANVTELISDKDQENMNVDANTGKSINAIRFFMGKGILVWGARTLDGNSNEWRYVPVRRLFNYIEESVQKSTNWAVFQPNDANTWVKIQCQIENFLNNLWRDGALAGSTPDKAYYVKVGLDITMTADDINRGYLIVEIGLAAVRPAEFIVLKFSHKVQEA